MKRRLIGSLRCFDLLNNLANKFLFLFILNTYSKTYLEISFIKPITKGDSLDWKDYGADSIVDKVVNHKHLGNGSIILMHNGAKYTPQALEAVITGLQSKGYELVPISELIKKDNFHINHEGRQISDETAQH